MVPTHEELWNTFTEALRIWYPTRNRYQEDADYILGLTGVTKVRSYSRIERLGDFYLGLLNRDIYPHEAHVVIRDITVGYGTTFDVTVEVYNFGGHRVAELKFSYFASASALHSLEFTGELPARQKPQPLPDYQGSVVTLRKIMVMCAYMHWTYGVEDITKRYAMLEFDTAKPHPILPETVERIELEMD